jgi:hypothetical protein
MVHGDTVVGWVGGEEGRGNDGRRTMAILEGWGDIG